MKVLKIIGIAFGIFLVIGVAAGIMKDSKTPNPVVKEQPKVKDPVVRNSSFDGSVRQVKDYLKYTLNDASSYEEVKWGNVFEDTTKHVYWVQHQYRAANAFGAKMLITQTFFMDSSGIVYEVRN